MPTVKKKIDIEAVRASISYDPKTGIFRWLISKRGHRKAGDIAGSPTGKGHWRVKINQQTYAAGRLAWVMHYGREPEGEVDHRDGDGLGNRIKNLRDSAHWQNCQNRSDRGVRFEADRGRWLARIYFKGKQIHLGRFEREEDALEAYRSACIRLRGAFARGI